LIESKNDWKLPLYKIFTDDEDLSQITKIVKRGTYWAMGPEIEELENAIKNYVGCEYCLTLNSGTSALHAALLAYGFGPEDEIIVPSFTFISTVNSVRFVNSNPIFADIEDETFGLDPTSTSEKISARTKAIIPMDYGGLSCKIFEIQEIANNNNLVVIEDAAEALGATIKGKKAGTVSETAIYSFCGNKVLTTGEGGAVVTNSKEIYEKIKLIRSHGRLEKTSYFDDPSASNYIALGYNWRMSSITAALGISQLTKLEKIIKMRQEIANYISSRLSKCPKIRTPSSPDGYDHIYQMYTIRLPDKTTRDKLHSHLTEKRIFSKVYFEPIHLNPFYKEKYDFRQNLLPKTEKISNEVLTLPIYPNMTSEEKVYLVSNVLDFFESN